MAWCWGPLDLLIHSLVHSMYSVSNLCHVLGVQKWKEQALSLPLNTYILVGRRVDTEVNNQLHKPFQVVIKRIIVCCEMVREGPPEEVTFIQDLEYEKERIKFGERERTFQVVGNSTCTCLRQRRAWRREDWLTDTHKGRVAVGAVAEVGGSQILNPHLSLGTDPFAAPGHGATDKV